MEVILLALVFPMAVVMIAVNGVAAVFMFSYLFFWQKMRRWFNKKAGVDFMQEKRISADQKPLIYVGLVSGVAAFVISACGLESMVSGLGGFVFIGVVVWSYLRYVKLVPLVGEPVARWSTIFYFGSGATIVALSTAASAIAVMLYLTLLVAGKISDMSVESMSGSSGGGFTIKGVGKITEDGAKITVDKHSDGTFSDFHGNKYKENMDGSLHKEPF